MDLRIGHLENPFMHERPIRRGRPGRIKPPSPSEVDRVWTDTGTDAHLCYVLRRTATGRVVVARRSSASLRMKPTDAAKYLEKGARTLAQWRRQRHGPVASKIRGTWRYKLTWLNAYIKAHTFTPAACLHLPADGKLGTST